MRHFAALGHPVVGIDRNSEAIAAVSPLGKTYCADIENGPWPAPDQSFGGVIVTNYLWRPLMPRILESIKPQGFLIYETFALGHETIGKPSRPDFLLQHGELLQICAQMHVIAYEDGYSEQPPKFVQRIVASPQVPNAGQRFGLGCR